VPESPVSWKAGPLYAPIRGFCILVKALLTRPRISGLEHLPRTGGVLIVSNHASNADPVVLMAVCPRPLIFMAKEELYRQPVARLILHLWGGSFPVRRGEADVRSVREALALLKDGAAVVVFPEGTRRPHGLGVAHPGIGYLASRTSAPVLPVAILGTDRINGLSDLRRRPRFEVRFGEPFTVSRDDPDPTETIMRRVASLLPPERHGIYAAQEPARAG
jgi:1-acyl-sn-glycerol-3-phosphate acyltransferase